MAPQSTASDPVAVTAIAMKLLDVRLKPSGAIVTSAIGDFTADGQQEIALLRAGGTIELHRIVTASGDDDEDSRTFFKLITRLETRSVLRCCSVVRLSGEKRDVLAIGADGGALSVIDFEGGKAKILHCVTFGKTGKFNSFFVCLLGIHNVSTTIVSDTLLSLSNVCVGIARTYLFIKLLTCSCTLT
jgi:hypothetical protein